MAHPPHSCGGCETRWGGLRTCHCSGCHRTFANIKAFDKHRFRYTCRIPAHVMNEHGFPVFQLNTYGYWSIISDRWGDDD